MINIVKKETRLKPIGRTPKARVSERGDSIGRVGRRPSKSKRTPLGGIASASKGMATGAMKKAAMELARRRKPSGRLSKDDMDRALDMIKRKKLKGKIQERFGKPVGKMPPKPGRARFMKK